MTFIAVVFASGTAIVHPRLAVAQENADLLQQIESESAASLAIGMPAPALDIEHWIQDGNGRFKPLEKFAKGNVYVVEFWATWCAQCVLEMPTIANLQQKHRRDNVQIISITDETVDEVKQLLALKHPRAPETMIAEITSVYCLTADPDRSAHDDYVKASGISGIPIAFIVGKTGLIEWIGHPGLLEQPLQLIVDDKWERERFKQVWDTQRLDESISKRIDALLAKEDFAGAIGLVDMRVQSLATGETNGNRSAQRERWIATGASLRLSSGKAGKATYDYFLEKMRSVKDQPLELIRFGLSLEPVFRDGKKLGPLPRETAAQLEKLASKIEPEQQPVYNYCLALMCEFDGRLKQAIAFQERAVQAAPEEQKKPLGEILKRYREQFAKQK